VNRLGFILALGLAAVACGDDGNTTPDAPKPPIDGTMIDAPMIDAPPAPVTLTSYVIDLITNHTDNGPPRAFTDFSTLMDPDQTNNNLAAYASLFP
jgi:hypothetical protein